MGTNPFREHMRGKKWLDFFAFEGHCNDAGYRLMAEVVGERLLRMRQGR